MFAASATLPAPAALGVRLSVQAFPNNKGFPPRPHSVRFTGRGDPPLCLPLRAVYVLSETLYSAPTPIAGVGLAHSELTIDPRGLCA